MKEYHLFYAPGLPGDATLPADEAAHALRVLRMKAGDEMLCTDGRGAVYRCLLTAAEPRACALRVVQRHAVAPEWLGEVHLAVAPTKNADRLEWLAEKATEVGFNGMHLLLCANAQRRVMKTERLERIVVSAMKQSHKALKPEVAPLEAFAAFIARPFAGRKYIAHCLDMPSLCPDADEAGGVPPRLFDVHPAGESALVLIGPEGDFTLDEVRAAEQAGFRSVSLGRCRLRTETAALAAVHMLALRNAR